jgi:hypothetical protein
MEVLFYSWRAMSSGATREASRKKNSLQRFTLRFVNMCKFKAFDCWRANLDDLRIKRQIIRRILRRMKSRVICIILEMWMDHVKEQRRLQAVKAKVVSNEL